MTNVNSNKMPNAKFELLILAFIWHWGFGICHSSSALTWDLHKMLLTVFEGI
jgi:hypothetical protein